MREEILLNMANPRQLEKLYRDNKPSFKTAFNDLYPQLKDNLLADYWHQRLNYDREDQFWGTPNERVFVVAASLLAGFLAKLPEILSLEPELFYQRNIGFIVFPLLTAYFAWKNKISPKTNAYLTGLTLMTLVFINSFPRHPSDTLILSCIHLPLWLWSILGFSFGGGKLNNWENRLGFLRYNGDLVVMAALLVLPGILLSGITIGLFSLIGLQIEKLYFNYVVVCGLAAIPIVGTFLTQTQPALVNKISPVIAKLFSPVALVMLVVYLIATVFSGKDPYHDREFLLLFNALLIGVMALIFFSVAGATSVSKNTTQIFILFLLSVVTILVNGIALSAVLFRITEWGITPNRAAVLGANLLMLAHLLLVGIRLFGVLTRKSDLSLVGKAMVLFLPIYCVWSGVVTFLFPLFFGFK